MPTINLETYINAPIQRVFDLARSIDLHKNSAGGTDEKAVAGKTSELIKLGEKVTWRAKHFGIYQNLTVEVIEFSPPNMFVDQMIAGAFKFMKHTHSFKTIETGTIMTDQFEFESPLGILGHLANILFLKKYMTRFLENKNKELKQVAESELWRKYL